MLNIFVKTINRSVPILLALIFVCSALSCHSASAPKQAAIPKYTTYRDIPGVTEQEINAISALQARSASFVYGAIPSTETYYNENGEISGFTALLGEWLTDLFGIPFEIEFYEWGELLDGLENGQIDFTGELTANEERRESYYMTDAIAGRSLKYMRIAGRTSLTHIAAARPLRYAFLKGKSTCDNVSAQAGAPFDAHFVNGYPEAYHLLKNQDIDAFIDEGTAEAAFAVYGDVVSGDFYPLIYGPVSLATHNLDNEPIISVVQKALQNDGIHHFTEMYNLGTREYTQYKLFMSLNEEEKAYIANHPVVNFVAEYDNYPVSFYNTRDRE